MSAREPDADLTPIVAPLLAWWDAGHADLPWRQTRDPYAIWVAEIMLQQTQIATVIPYYTRWLARFPDVAALAAAPLADVLKLWEGLGYYSRARHLHAAAQRIVAQHDAQLPATAAALRQLPGIGRYTAGAIASIAFGEAAAVVDGNVVRVLARLLDLADDVTASATQRRLWAIAEATVPAQRPGAYNQALMELGQRVCLSSMPRCTECPLVAHCGAARRGTQLARPVRPPRRRTPHYDVAAGVIYRPDGRFLITRRPLHGLLGGLWEFPGGKQEAGEALPQTLAREIREELGIDVAAEGLIVRVPHAFTHFRLTIHAFRARYLAGEVQHIGVIDHAWVTLAELAPYAFSHTNRQIIAALNGAGHQPPLL